MHQFVGYQPGGVLRPGLVPAWREGNPRPQSDGFRPHPLRKARSNRIAVNPHRREVEAESLADLPSDVGCHGLPPRCLGAKGRNKTWELLEVMLQRRRRQASVDDPACDSLGLTLGILACAQGVASGMAGRFGSRSVEGMLRACDPLSFSNATAHPARVAADRHITVTTTAALITVHPRERVDRARRIS